MPPILDDLDKLFGGKGDGKGKFFLLMILLVVLAVIGGILTTVAIVRATAAKYSGTVSEQIESLRRSEGRRPAMA